MHNQIGILKNSRVLVHYYLYIYISNIIFSKAQDPERLDLFAQHLKRGYVFRNTVPFL